MTNRVELLAKVVNQLWDEARMDELPAGAQAHIITGLMLRYINTNPNEINRLISVVQDMLQATIKSLER